MDTTASRCSPGTVASLTCADRKWTAYNVYSSNVRERLQSVIAFMRVLIERLHAEWLLKYLYLRRGPGQSLNPSLPLSHALPLALRVVTLLG